MHSKQKVSKLFYVPETLEYRMITNPVISTQNGKILQEKLNIQRQSAIAVQRRIKNNTCFINYHRNPFDNLKKKHQHKFSSSSYTSQAKSLPSKKKKVNQQEQITILSEISNLGNNQRTYTKVKERVRRSSKFRSVSPLITYATQQTKKTLNDIKKQQNAPNIDIKAIKQREQSEKEELQKELKRKIFKFIYKDNQQTPAQIPQLVQTEKKMTYTRNQNKDKGRSKNKIRLMNLDQILAINERNYFVQHQRLNFNVFRVPQNDEQIMTGVQRLSQDHFSFNSIHYMASKIKVETHRQISGISRKNIVNVSKVSDDIVENMNSEELAYNKDRLKYIDLMNLASGRFTPEFLTRVEDQISGKTQTNNQNDDLDNSSEQQLEGVIFYKKDQRTFQGAWAADAQQQLQIQGFLVDKYKPFEEQLSDKYQQLVNRLGNMLNQRNEAVNHRIYDKKLRQQHDNSIKNKINQFIETPQSSHRSTEKNPNMDIDRKIRRNKISKDKEESIKLTKCIDILKIKSQKDYEIKNNLGI